MLGSLMLYLKGMRIMMFQLSGFYCIAVDDGNENNRNSNNTDYNNTQRVHIHDHYGIRPPKP